MRTTTTFIIRPKPTLQQLCKHSDLGDSPFDSEPVLWTYEDSDRVAWSREEIYEGVKILFLMHLRSQFLSAEEVRVFQDLPATAETFDRYWDMEIFRGPDEQVEDVFRLLDKEECSELLLESENSFLKATAAYIRAKRD